MQALAHLGYLSPGPRGLLSDSALILVTWAHTFDFLSPPRTPSLLPNARSLPEPSPDPGRGPDVVLPAPASFSPGPSEVSGYRLPGHPAPGKQGPSLASSEGREGAAARPASPSASSRPRGRPGLSRSLGVCQIRSLAGFGPAWSWLQTADLEPNHWPQACGQAVK